MLPSYYGVSGDSYPMTRVVEPRRIAMSMTYMPVPEYPALIDREYHVRRPNGVVVRVNRFDFNLAWCADRTTYIQCSDFGWSKVATLTIVEAGT
jgi:hypothetical protein